MSILMNDSENVEDKIKFEKRLHLIHNQSTLKNINLNIYVYVYIPLHVNLNLKNV